MSNIVFDVDFNNVASGGRIKASMRHASSNRRPDLGETVYLRDPEGNACRARVDELRGQILLLVPNWENPGGRVADDSTPYGLQTPGVSESKGGSMRNPTRQT